MTKGAKFVGSVAEFVAWVFVVGTAVAGVDFDGTTDVEVVGVAVDVVVDVSSHK